MISCLDFRTSFRPGSEDAALLEHLRSCDPCLDFAAHVDPDVMFRALGGAEMIPPGGVDAFVADVMHAVQLRVKEESLAPARVIRWPRRLAAAAVVAAGVTGAALFYQAGRAPLPEVQRAAVAVPAAQVRYRQQPLTTKPVVDTYSSAKATILEVPSEGLGDTKIVMVIDENLPADL